MYEQDYRGKIRANQLLCGVQMYSQVFEWNGMMEKKKHLKGYIANHCWYHTVTCCATVTHRHNVHWIKRCKNSTKFTLPSRCMVNIMNSTTQTHSCEELLDTEGQSVATSMYCEVSVPFARHLQQPSRDLLLPRQRFCLSHCGDPLPDLGLRSSSELRYTAERHTITVNCCYRSTTQPGTHPFLIPVQRNIS